jgi:hypothetical protein
VEGLWLNIKLIRKNKLSRSGISPIEISRDCFLTFPFNPYWVKKKPIAMEVKKSVSKL